MVQKIESHSQRVDNWGGVQDVHSASSDNRVQDTPWLETGSVASTKIKCVCTSKVPNLNFS